MSFFQRRGKIVGILTTLSLAFAILLVSVLKSASTTYTYSPVVLSGKVESKAVVEPIDYFLSYPGKIHPDNLLWYPKVVRDKVWYATTFNKDKKAELNLLFADKRLNSSLILFQNNKPDLGFTTLNKAEKYLEKAIPSTGDNTEYLKKLVMASLKHIEILETEILPIAPEDLRPEVIKLCNSTNEVYRIVRELMLSKGLVPPENPFKKN